MQHQRNHLSIALVLALCLGVGTAAVATPPHVRRPQVNRVTPRHDTQHKIDELIGEVHQPEVAMRVNPQRSKLIRFKQPVLRVSNTHPQVLKIVFYSRTEAELIGVQPGVTNLTLWFAPAPGETQPRVLKFTAGSAAPRR